VGVRGRTEVKVERQDRRSGTNGGSKKMVGINYGFEGTIRRGEGGERSVDRRMGPDRAGII